MQKKIKHQIEYKIYSKNLSFVANPIEWDYNKKNYVIKIYNELITSDLDLLYIKIPLIIYKFHNAGFVHMDLHKNNIMLDPKTKEPVFIDFEHTFNLDEISYRDIEWYFNEPFERCVYSPADIAIFYDYYKYFNSIGNNSLAATLNNIIRNPDNKLIIDEMMIVNFYKNKKLNIYDNLFKFSILKIIPAEPTFRENLIANFDKVYPAIKEKIVKYHKIKVTTVQKYFIKENILRAIYGKMPIVFKNKYKKLPDDDTHIDKIKYNEIYINDGDYIQIIGKEKNIPNLGRFKFISMAAIDNDENYYMKTYRWHAIIV